MFRCEGGAQRCHRTVKSRLMEGNGIHVPLREDDTPQPGLLGDIQREQVASLVEDRGVRRVEIFGRRIIQHPAAKADHIPPQIDDGKHHPVETIVHPSILPLYHQAALQKLCLFIALLGHGGDQVIPSLRGHTQSEPRHRPP